jgi:hypothetical protein
MELFYFGCESDFKDAITPYDMATPLHVLHIATVQRVGNAVFGS